MIMCLKRFKRRKIFEATGDDVVKAIALLNNKLKDDIFRRAIAHVITEAATCGFAKLQDITSCLNTDNKKKLHAVLLEAKLMLWDPEKNRELRFWD